MINGNDPLSLMTKKFSEQQPGVSTTSLSANPSLANLLLIQDQIKAKNAEVQNKLAAYNEAALQTPSLRFMKEDQGFLDAIKDPTKAQRNAIIQFGLGLAGSNSTNSLSQRIGQALGVGMQALQTGRQAELQRETAKAKSDLVTAQTDVSNLQTDFGNRLRIASLLKPTTETTQDRLMAEYNFNSYTGALGRAESALAMNQELDIMDQALIGDTFQTGVGSQFVGRVKSFAQYLGVPEEAFEGLSQQEMFGALSNRLALLVRNPESGLGLPGNTSNKDLQFLIDSVPSLSKTPQGNKLLIQVLKAKNQFQIDYGKEVNRIVQENGGTVPNNLNSQMLEFANNYQILSPDLRQAITEENENPSQFKFKEAEFLDPLPENLTYTAEDGSIIVIR